MWELKSPEPAKLIVGILGASIGCLEQALTRLEDVFGDADLTSDVWPFAYTGYYQEETGKHIHRQFVSFARLLSPDRLATAKHKTNEIERELAAALSMSVPRPLNLDPGLIEPSKLVLASTKNFAHRVYIGRQIWAEVTLRFDRGAWTPLPYTYPDYRQGCYFAFFSMVRDRLRAQLRQEQGR